MKLDKSNGVVILNKYDYNKKMDEILSDTLKFELLNDDAIKLTLQRENQITTLLTKLEADDCIDEKTYKELYRTGRYTYRHTIWTPQNSQIPHSFKTYSILYQPLFV